MGLRLKAQLICLFLALSLGSFSVLTYFNLALSAQDNLTRTELSARKLSDWVSREVEAQLRGSAGRAELSKLNAGLIGADLQRTHELSCLEIFNLDGTRLFSAGHARRPASEQSEMARSALGTSEPVVHLWAYNGEGDLQGVPLEQVGPLFHGVVEAEHYQWLTGDLDRPIGLMHLTIELPRAPLRLNLVLLGNLWLGGTFLLSSLLAYYFWAEFAINRPLKGLMEAQQRLRELDPAHSDDANLISSNELVTISRSFNRLTLDLVKYQRELEEKTRRLEEANLSYRRLNEELELKVEEKTRDMKEFFSLITHDLRIPLSAVAGYAELLVKPRSGPLSEKQVKYARSISVANSHALELVRNLLDAMRYEFGEPQVVEEDFDLCELSHEVINHLAVPLKGESAPSIALEAPPSCHVSADRTRIGRVLSNLLGNAVRHAEQVTLHLEELPNEGKVRVEVRDRGQGIPREHLPHLFDKFKQLPPTEGETEGSPSSGLGLGLYIVRRILEDHGEVIEVESQSGPPPSENGTTFRFHLPLAESRAEVRAFEPGPEDGA